MGDKHIIANGVEFNLVGSTHASSWILYRSKTGVDLWSSKSGKTWLTESPFDSRKMMRSNSPDVLLNRITGEYRKRWYRIVRKYEGTDG